MKLYHKILLLFFLLLFALPGREPITFFSPSAVDLSSLVQSVFQNLEHFFLSLESPDTLPILSNLSFLASLLPEPLSLALALLLIALLLLLLALCL